MSEVSSRKNESPVRIAHLHVEDKKNKGDVAIVLAVQELLRARFKSCRIIDFPVTVLSAGRAADLKKINSTDLVVIGGGGLFYSYFLPYDRNFIAAITSPIIIFGAGYIREVGAPALSRTAAQSVAALAKRAALIGVRDHNTKKFLVRQGVRPTTISVIGDPAILLSEKKSQKSAIKTRARRQAEGKSEKNAAVSSPVRIGLNLNYSGWLGFGRWREDILNSYREVVNYFYEAYGGPNGRGVEIYYLQHHPSEKEIYPELRIPGLRVVDLPPAEQKYVYGQLDLVIGMMLHTGVLAFGAGTPEISVAYDLRNYSFAEFIGCPELVVDLEQLKNGELLKRVKNIFTKIEKYGSIFRQKKRKISKKQLSFLKKINFIARF